jgi:hypothetical protein
MKTTGSKALLQILLLCAVILSIVAVGEDIYQNIRSLFGLEQGSGTACFYDVL